MEYSIKKYPRTPHLEGSRLQAGDEDLSQVAFAHVKGRRLVIEEKIDGANVALSFDADGTLLLQSRGHYLVGGAREAHYDLFKQWASAHSGVFWDVLKDRYVVYGEWMYAKHKIFYDALPHYFVEFDIYDRAEGCFLDTERRRALTTRLPICSVPVLAEGVFDTREEVLSYLSSSRYATPDSTAKLTEYCNAHGLDVNRVLSMTDVSPLMEGLYIKVEEDGVVTERLKYVRLNYTQGASLDTQDWLKQKIIPNQLSVPFDSLFD